MTLADILPAIGGAAGIAAAVKAAWSWWTQRDATKSAATASERADLVAELRASRDASEARGAKAQERADALVATLHELAQQVARGNDAAAALSDAVNSHAQREEHSIAEILARLRVASETPAPTTGEQPRASMLPSLPTRAPTPPRGGR